MLTSATLLLTCAFVSAGLNEATPARADDAAPAASRRPFPTREELASGARRGADRGDGLNAGRGGWWLGTAGVAAALAGCGWLSLAAKRWKPASAAGAAGLRVIGRTSLSPRHAVYLLQAGDRVLLVGTGPQGAPSLLGEMPGDPPRAHASRPRADVAHDEPPSAARSPRFDLRLGDES